MACVQFVGIQCREDLSRYVETSVIVTITICARLRFGREVNFLTTCAWRIGLREVIFVKFAFYLAFFAFISRFIRQTLGAEKRL